MRQHLYELALGATTFEEARALYSDLLKEEAKLRELEIAGQKMALAADEMRVRRARLRLDAHKARGIVRVTTEAEALDAPEVKELTAGPGERRKDEELRGLLKRLDEVINRGGPADEKVCEARWLLGSERKLLE